MPVKEFKTIDEQIEILKSRGLNITDETSAREFLYRNNYYRISGYSLTLRNHDIFFQGTTFQNIIDIYIYKFDAEFRNILLGSIEKIEVEVKSIYAYEFSKRYGALGYTTSANFTDYAKYMRIRAKAEEQKNSRLSHEAFLKHFVEKCNGDIPLWAYVDLFSIADISIFYQISRKELKDAVAVALGLQPNTRTEILEKYMHGMTVIRNLCAHGSRLYNRLFITKPSLNSKEKQLLRKDKDGNIDNLNPSPAAMRSTKTIRF